MKQGLNKFEKDEWRMTKKIMSKRVRNERNREREK